MPRVFDVVLASNDMSLDRVLGAGLPVVLVFHERELPSELRQKMDELAREYAGKALLVTLLKSDAPQALSRFGIHQFPTLLTVQAGKPVTRQENLRPEDLGAHLKYIVGEGPKPNIRTTPQPSATGTRQTAAQTPIHVNETNFDREVLRADRPVLVDFWAPWCGPCRMVEPTLNKLAHEKANVLKIVKVNVDENPGLAGRYGAMSIPTMLVVANGREVDRWVGALPENALRNRVARWIQPKPQTA